MVRPHASVSTRARNRDSSRHTVEPLSSRRLGLDSDAARELAGLTDRYSRDPDVLMALATMLNEVGAYHHALRLARARFRDKLERTGGIVDPSLWKVAYPTGLLPTIKGQRCERCRSLSGGSDHSRGESVRLASCVAGWCDWPDAGDAGNRK